MEGVSNLVTGKTVLKGGRHETYLRAERSGGSWSGSRLLPDMSRVRTRQIRTVGQKENGISVLCAGPIPGIPRGDRPFSAVYPGVVSADAGEGGGRWDRKTRLTWTTAHYS